MIFLTLQKNKSILTVMMINAFLVSSVIFSITDQTSDSMVHKVPSFEQVLPIIQPDSPITINSKEITIATKQTLHKVEIAKYEEPVFINGMPSIAKVFNIHPEDNNNLDAEITFVYEDSELNGLSEDNLILYSSIDEGKTWQAHHNSFVDTKNNSIHLDDIEHFSLWTAAEVGGNGFANTLGTTEDGVYTGTYTDTMNRSVANYFQSCTDPNLYADNCDFDGDGIINGDDLDDDNDGVLDSEECAASSSQSIAQYVAFGVKNPSTTSSELWAFTDLSTAPVLITTNMIGAFDVNHLATDLDRDRIIIANHDTQVSLFAYYFSGPNANTAVNLGSGFLSSLSTSTAGATFYDDSYYIWDDEGASRGLYEVSFDVAGNASSLTKVADVAISGSVDTTLPNGGGDISASKDGILYAIESNEGFGVNGELWSLDLNNIGAGWTLLGVPNLTGGQLFFDNDGRLVANTSLGALVELSTTDGSILSTISTAATSGWLDLSEGPLAHAACLDIDTDNDSIFNRFDLDSDGDGCFDVYEAGVTGVTTNGSVTDSLAATTIAEVGANGFADVLETAEDGVAIYTSTYSTNALNNAVYTCLQSCTDPNLYADNCDFDGDGISNGDDLDDDNDGVLDSEECAASSSQSIAQYVAFGVKNPSTTSSELWAFTDLNTAPVLITTNMIGAFDVNHLATDLDRDRIIIANHDAQGGLFAYYFSGPNANTAVNLGTGFLSSLSTSTAGATFYDDSYYIWDDEGTSRGLYEVSFDVAGNASSLTKVADVAISGSVDTTLPNGGGDISASKDGILYAIESNEGFGVNGELWSLDLNNIGAGWTLLGVPNLTGGQLFFDDDGRLVASTSLGTLVELSTTDGSILSTISTTATSGWLDLSEGPLAHAACLDIDTDNDSIFNRFDLDSDGDGCPDAIEASVTPLADLMNGDVVNGDGTTNTITSTADANFIFTSPTNDTNGDGYYDGAAAVTTDYKTDALDEAVNNCPINTTIAENDINQTPQDVNVSGDVLTNDTDDEGDTQTVTAALADTDGDGMVNDALTLGTATTIYGTDDSGVTVVAGTITLNAEGTYTFDPEPNFTGDAPLAYTATDDNTLVATDNAVLVIEVLSSDDPATNQPPVANDDTNSTELDTNVGGNIIAPNDSDPDGDDITVTAVLVDSDGDGMVDDVLTVAAAPIPIYGSDEDGNTVLAGKLSLTADGTYAFDPEITFIGEVQVDYTISDGILTDDARLTITVEPDAGNTTYANDDTNIGNQGDPQFGNVVTNDNDPELGDIQTVSGGTTSNGTTITPGTEVTLPSGGTLTLNTDGSYSYMPNPTFVGTEVVAYMVCDDETPKSACETATLYLTTLPYSTCGSGIIEYAMTNGAENTTGYQWDNVSAPAGDVPSTQMYGLHRSTEYCEFGGWRHYYNSNQTDKFLFSIEMGSNTTEIEYIDIRVAENPESRYDTTATNALFGMARDWHVKTVGDAALTAPVNIRFYYVPSELKTILDGAIALAETDLQATMPTPASIVWFKKDTYDPTADINPDGLTLANGGGYTVLTPNVVANANGESEVDNSTFGNGVNYVQFNGITGFSGGSAFVPVSGSALPVELTSFSGMARDCDVQLNWSSATEEHFSHYEIEWSGTGREFMKIQEIEGGGFLSVERHYQFTDEAASTINYYRLKMVDTDGSYEYSSVAFVETNCGEHNILVYPNPIGKNNDGVLNIDFYALENEAQLEISDVLGRVVKRLSIGVSTREVNTITLDVSDLPSGAYMIHVVGNKGSNKFIVQD